MSQAGQTQGHLNPDTACDRELGFWLFLMGDLIIFALLFVTYVIMRPNSASGPGATTLFSLSRVGIETALLLISSFTFGIASIMAAGRSPGSTLGWLLITLLLGLGFLLMEYVDFAGLVVAGNGPSTSGFLSSYFVLVGTHGLHVAAGALWLAVSAVQITQRRLTDAMLSRLTRLALFWHFLDIIWIGIFSIVYLPEFV